MRGPIREQPEYLGVPALHSGKLFSVLHELTPGDPIHRN